MREWKFETWEEAVRCDLDVCIERNFGGEGDFPMIERMN